MEHILMPNFLSNSFWWGRRRAVGNISNKQWDGNESIHVIFCPASTTEAWPKTIVSSTNWWCVVAGKRVDGLKPLILLALLLAPIVLPNTSAIGRKRDGDRGSPCLRPRWEKNNPAGSPLMRIEKDGEETQVRIHLRHKAPKPNLLNTWSRKLQFTPLFAYLISGASPPLLYCPLNVALHGFLLCHQQIVSCLPSCCFEINPGNNGRSRLARSLVSICKNTTSFNPWASRVSFGDHKDSLSSSKK